MRVLWQSSQVLVVLMWAPIQQMPDLVRYLGVLAAMVLFLQGLAVVHGMLAKTGSGSVWLVVLYLLLIFFMPQAVMVLATVGLMDVWIDFRARVGEKGPTGQ